MAHEASSEIFSVSESPYFLRCLIRTWTWIHNTVVLSLSLSLSLSKGAGAGVRVHQQRGHVHGGDPV